MHASHLAYIFLLMYTKQYDIYQHVYEETGLIFMKCVHSWWISTMYQSGRSSPPGLACVLEMYTTASRDLAIAHCISRKTVTLWPAKMDMTGLGYSHIRRIEQCFIFNKSETFVWYSWLIANVVTSIIYIAVITHGMWWRNRASGNCIPNNYWYIIKLSCLPLISFSKHKKW
jgi:hypothetical protein